MAGSQLDGACIFHSLCDSSAMVRGEGARAVKRPILIVCSDRELSLAVRELLSEEGFTVATSPNPERAAAQLQTSHYALVVTDYLFGSIEKSHGLARELQRASAQAPIGCVTAWPDMPPEIESGYTFVLRQPIQSEQFLASVGRYAVSQEPDPVQASTIDSYFEALSQRDWDRVAALCTDSVHYHLPGTDALSRTIEGREAFRTYTEETFRLFPEAKFEVTERDWLPLGVIASYQGQWRTPDGGIARSSGEVYFRFVGEKISEIGVRTDLAQLRAQLTSTETPGLKGG